MRSTLLSLISVMPGMISFGYICIKEFFVRLKCKQLFMELQNREKDHEPAMWVQNGDHLAEQGSYNVAHPLTRRRLYEKE